MVAFICVQQWTIASFHLLLLLSLRIELCFSFEKNQWCHLHRSYYPFQGLCAVRVDHYLFLSKILCKISYFFTSVLLNTYTRQLIMLLNTLFVSNHPLYDERLYRLVYYLYPFVRIITGFFKKVVLLYLHNFPSLNRFQTSLQYFHIFHRLFSWINRSFSFYNRC